MSVLMGEHLFFYASSPLARLSFSVLFVRHYRSV